MAQVATRLCLLPGEPGRISSGSVCLDLCFESRLFLVVVVSKLLVCCFCERGVGWLLVGVTLEGGFPGTI